MLIHTLQKLRYNSIMTALNFPDSPTDGEEFSGYVWSDSDNVWNRLPEAPGINLGNLGDVTITSVATDEVLAYNGSNWVNATAGSGFTASETITANNATWPVPTLASPIVKVTVIGGGGGGGSAGGGSSENAGDGGTSTFNAGGALTISATGGAAGRASNRDTAGTVGTTGDSAGNGGGAGMNGGGGQFGSPGQGGQVRVTYLDLTGVSTVNVTVGAGGTAGTGGVVAAAGGRGEVIVEYLAG
jgi:hypothetical protein